MFNRVRHKFLIALMIAILMLPVSYKLMPDLFAAAYPQLVQLSGTNNVGVTGTVTVTGTVVSNQGAMSTIGNAWNMRLSNGLSNFNWGTLINRWPVIIVNSSGVEVGTALTPYNIRTTTATTFSTGWVTVLNTATLIKAANTSRASIALRNIGSVDAYIGSYSTIATSSGFPIKANESLTLDRNTSAIYGVVVSDATNIIYLEE